MFRPYRVAVAYPFFVVVLCTCSNPRAQSPPPARLASGAPTAIVGPAAPESEARESEPRPEDIVVGSKRGLEAWGRDGEMVRLISPGPALFPRWLDHDTLLVIVPPGEEPLSRGFRVESIEHGSGERKLLSAVPEFACTGGGPEAEGLAQISVWHQGDFRVDRKRGLACVSLFNSYREAATFGFEVQLELGGGGVQRWAAHKPDQCALAGPMHSGSPAESCVTETAAEAEPRMGEFGLGSSNEGTLVTRAEQPPLLVPGYERELVSPSGYWVLLHGDISYGDYVHRNFVLLHLRTGALYPVPEPTRHWPKAIARVGTDAVVKTPVENTRDGIGESSVRWFGTSELDELLLIDDLVVRPGRLVFSPEGEVAL